ncbi:hypothetical protein [Providencia rettgeri]|uniref:hypothetical protein n=1 Tax=Providencia rettgeri TaxID=587 RepID=UPI00155ED8B4|nr:hypothetical protein [Providencia rettgeri]QKG45172.1 hypothetical protein HRD55_11485 [Providencia rettgeri]QNN31407.1 hypothetical protein H9X60_11490 [Providencia rettgeri]
MDYNNEFKKIYKISKIVLPIMIFLSPFLLLSYLRTINAHGFFLSIISDSYIFTILGITSILITLSLILFYIMPTILWLINKYIISYTPSKNPSKIITFEHRKNKKKYFNIKKERFFVAILIAPVIVYQIILSNFNGWALTLILIFTSTIASYLILCYDKITINKNEKIIYLAIIPIGIIDISIIITSINALYFTENFLIRPSILILTIVLLFIFIYLPPAYFKKQKIELLDLSKNISLILLSLFILHISLLFLLITNELIDIDNDSFRSNFKLLIIIITLYAIPNSITLFISGGNKYLALVLYFTLICTFTNVINFIAFRTFNFIGITNEHIQYLIIDKWKTPNQPLGYKSTLITGGFYIAYQGNNGAILCQTKNNKPIITPKLNEKTKSEDVKCIYAEYKNITQIYYSPKNTFNLFKYNDYTL